MRTYGDRKEKMIYRTNLAMIVFETLLKIESLKFMYCDNVVESKPDKDNNIFGYVVLKIQDPQQALKIFDDFIRIDRDISILKTERIKWDGLMKQKSQLDKVLNLYYAAPEENPELQHKQKLGHD